MFNIKSFLKKYETNIDRISNIKNIINVELRTFFDISENDYALKIKNGVIYVQSEPLIKNDILMKKLDVIDAINKKIESAKISYKITDIR